MGFYGGGYLLKISERNFLKIVPFGVCHKCLCFGKVLPLSRGAQFAHYKCQNKNCDEYEVIQDVPLEVVNFLFYLMDHQPRPISRETRKENPDNSNHDSYS